jgi:hypothetical protein
MLRTVPLFAYDSNRVTDPCRLARRSPVATGIYLGAGNYTFGIWREGGDTSAMRETINEFARMGCPIEAFSDKLLSLS